MRIAWLSLAAATLVFAGCARYEYALVEPARLARSFTEKEPARITFEPLEYDFAVRGDQLSIGIANPTVQPVRIVAANSYAVSPDGASHPAGVAGTIAPRSFTALVLPPQPPVYRSRPSFSIGFGVGSYGFGGRGPYVGHGLGYHFYDSFYEGPRDYYPMNLPNYWRWKTGQVRLRLAYEQGTNSAFVHDLVLERRKVNHE